MAQFKTLLVPIDFSPSSESGARLAARLAKRLDARAILLYACPRRQRLAEDGYEGGESPNESEAYGAERLAEVATRAGFGASTEQLIEEGQPSEVICREAEERGADLIVLATRGFGAYRADLLGSNTVKVLHDSSAPVLTTVHRGEAPAGGKQLSRIVCSVDLNNPSLEALRRARDLASAAGASLTALYIAPAIPIEEHARKDFQATLLASSRRRMTQILEEADVEAEVIIEPGALGSSVAAVIERLGADLLVVARRAKGAGRLTAQGYEILRSSPCPVLSL